MPIEVKRLQTNKDVEQYYGSMKSINTSTTKDVDFIMYFADWCGHCTALKENIAQAQKLITTNTPIFRFILVSDELIKQLQQHQHPTLLKHNVSGFPTVIYEDSNGVMNNNVLTDRSPEGIIDAFTKTSEKQYKQTNKPKKNKQNGAGKNTQKKRQRNRKSTQKRKPKRKRKSNKRNKKQ
jgi:thiol:disulfide interchange protein